MWTVPLRLRGRSRSDSIQAFTLLEVVIVLIIVGVLAAIALPSFFRNVERARGAEAVANLGVISRAADGCYAQTRDFCLCTGAPGGAVDWNVLGLSDFGALASAHFTYEVSGCAADTHTIMALRNSYDTGDNGLSGISITREVNGRKHYTGSGVFTGYSN